jgi:trans-aconitate 2-methyltransferase
MSSSKSFAPIHADYAFFETHATEAEADAEAYLPHLHRLSQTHRTLRLLDFGGGGGRFTGHLLRRARLAPERLALTLAEPDPVYLRHAAEHLAVFTSHPVQAWPRLPKDTAAAFDLVIANHVFYYVVELREHVERLVRALDAVGLLVTSIAGQHNALIQLWNACFEILGMPVPFHTAEDLEAVLAALGLRYERRDIRYELAFPDTTAHRVHFLRFLLGSYFDEAHVDSMLAFFEPYRKEGRIVMQPVHEQYSVSRA